MVKRSTQISSDSAASVANTSSGDTGSKVSWPATEWSVLDQQSQDIDGGLVFSGETLP
jgi:hypothetical protein